MIDFSEAAQRNLRRSRALILALLLGALTLGLGLDLSLGTFGRIPPLTTLAMGGSAAAALVALRLGDRLVLLSVRAREPSLEKAEERQLVNLVREMALASGLPMPRVRILPDKTINALATGRDPQHATVAVTDGLLRQLDRAQTQAVVAHEMAHIGNRDTRLGVLVAILVGVVALLGDVADHARRGQRLDEVLPSGSKGAPDSGGSTRSSQMWILSILVLLLAIFGPLAAQLIAFAVSREREHLADADAVRFTREPEALIGALEAIAKQKGVSVIGNRGTAHLFFSAPRTSWMGERRGWLADLWATHPPIAERIRRLRGMIP